jgi:hypothetical protein
MDTWAFVIIVASVLLYLVTKRHRFFVLTLGIGIGLLWGALWASSIINSAFGS